MIKDTGQGLCVCVYMMKPIEKGLTNQTRVKKTNKNWPCRSKEGNDDKF